MKRLTIKYKNYEKKYGYRGQNNTDNRRSYYCRSIPLQCNFWHPCRYSAYSRRDLSSYEYF